MVKKAIHLKEHSYTVIYEPVEKKGYQVIVPLLPGLVTYGRNIEEAREMAHDAIRCYLESLLKRKEKYHKKKIFCRKN